MKKSISLLVLASLALFASDAFARNDGAKKLNARRGEVTRAARVSQKVVKSGRSAKAPCGAVTAEGYCDGDIAYWCDSEDNSLHSTNCATMGGCGYVGNGYGYYCMAYAPQECGNVTEEGYCGTDEYANIVYWCNEDGLLATRDCTDQGGCGYNELYSGYYCLEEGQVETCPDDMPAEGYCDGNVAYWCRNDNTVAHYDCTDQGGCGQTQYYGFYCLKVDQIPPTWDVSICEATWYGDGEDCDCGCGAFDTDCPSTSPESCDFDYCEDFGLVVSSSDNGLCEAPGGAAGSGGSAGAAGGEAGSGGSAGAAGGEAGSGGSAGAAGGEAGSGGSAGAAGGEAGSGGSAGAAGGGAAGSGGSAGAAGGGAAGSGGSAGSGGGGSGYHYIDASVDDNSGDEASGCQSMPGQGGHTALFALLGLLPVALRRRNRK